MNDTTANTDPNISRFHSGFLTPKETTMVNTAEHAQQELEAMRQCPRFSSCSAPICPLDPNWRLRDMVAGDPTCTWLLEIAKGEAMTQDVPGFIRLRVATLLPDLLPSVGLAPLRTAMKRASKTGSRRATANLRKQEA